MFFVCFSVQVEGLKEEDVMTQTLAVVGAKYPSLKTALIDERNEYVHAIFYFLIFWFEKEIVRVLIVSHTIVSANDFHSQ